MREKGRQVVSGCTLILMLQCFAELLTVLHTFEFGI